MQFVIKILIQLAVTLLVRVVIALIEIWVGFDIGKAIAQLIWDQPAEKWIQTANWSFAFVIASIMVAAGLMLLRHKSDPDVGLLRISLSDATLEAYEATKGTITATMAEDFGSIEGFYASAFTTNGDFPVFGKRVSREGLPSRALVKIPDDDVRDLQFTNNANELKSRQSDGAHYTDLEMNKSDLKNLIEIIKGRG